MRKRRQPVDEPNYHERRFKRIEGTGEFFADPVTRQAIFAVATPGSQLTYRQLDVARDLWELLIWNAS